MMPGSCYDSWAVYRNVSRGTWGSTLLQGVLCTCTIKHAFAHGFLVSRAALQGLIQPS